MSGMFNTTMLQGLLDSSQAMITRASMRIPGFEQPVPFQYDLRVLQDRQASLQRALSTTRPSDNLGFPLLIVGAGVLGISAIGGWIYKHFTDAKKIETQTGVYESLREDGTSAERAAELVFGGKADWGKVTKNLLLISLVGTGVYLFSKFK